MKAAAAKRIGSPATASTGAASIPSDIRPPLIASAPTVGATPPSTPTATIRSGIAAAHPSV